MPRKLSLRVGYPPVTGITHGQQITTSNVGLAGVGKTTGDLTAYSGPTTITSATTISLKSFTSEIVVDPGAGNTVTIDSCYFNPTSVGSHTLWVKSGTLVVSNTDIVKGFSNGLFASLTGRFDATRVKISGSEDGATVGPNGSTMTECYVFGLVGDAASHYDGINCDGFTGWSLRRVRVHNPHNQTSAITVGYLNNSSSGECIDSYLSGGGYTMYAGPGTGSGITVSGNVWEAYGLTAAEGGSLPQYGHVTGGTSSGITWTNNKVWVDVAGTRTLKTLNADGSVT